MGIPWYVDTDDPRAPYVEVWLNGRKSTDAWTKVDCARNVGVRIKVNENNIPVIYNNELVHEPVEGSFELKWKAKS